MAGKTIDPLKRGFSCCTSITNLLEWLSGSQLMAQGRENPRYPVVVFEDRVVKSSCLEKGDSVSLKGEFRKDSREGEFSATAVEWIRLRT